jgi:membrane-bound metal-dependent hydrolase YbcI (DUF457 family)
VKSVTHYALGALVTGAVAPPLSRAVGLDLTPAELAVGVAIGTLAGVLPDIDTPRSVVTHGLLPLRGRGASAAVLLGQLLSIPPRAVGVLARSAFEHRGATHSLAFAAIWAVLAAPLYAALGCALIVGSGYMVELIAQLVAGADPLRMDPTAVVSWIVTRASGAMPLVILCVLCGYLSHLLADAMTIAPIRLWWPSRRRVWVLPRPLRIKTGGSFERYLLQPLAVIGAVAVIVVQVGIPLCNASAVL